MNKTYSTLLEEQEQTHKQCPSMDHFTFGWPARPHWQQFCADTGSSLEDLPGAMDDRDEWGERVKEICANSATWW